ncbi:MAG: hypothetical protein RL322_1778 [Pseudomonadota bacterium]
MSQDSVSPVEPVSVALPGMPGRWSTLLRLAMTAPRGARPARSVVQPHAWTVPDLWIDSDRMRRYQSLCGGLETSSTVPPLFPQVLAFPLLMHDLASSRYPWSALGVVHLGNDIEASRPIQPGEVLNVTLRGGGLISHPRGQAFETQLQFNQGEIEVWRSTQTFLRLGVRNPVGPAWDEQRALGGKVSDAGHPATHALVRIGAFDAPSQIGRRYAPISGDFNPIHLSKWSARMLGFDQAIAHGLWSLARALAVLGIEAPQAGHRLRTVFASPIRLPSSVSVWALREGGVLNFEVRDQAGERVHLKGSFGERRIKND